MYKRLIDSPVLKDGFTEIWYQKPEFIGKMLASDIDINVWDLKKTHVFLGSISEKEIENIFSLMQGENWSPNGEARDLIREKGLAHTSMSVGDIVILNGQVYAVDFCGFLQLS